VSVACNVVEGSARRTTAEYCHFLNIAAASASEARYLVELSSRLGFLAEVSSNALVVDYAELSASLQALMRALRPTDPRP
jgi:four helix bundle protein